MKHKTIVAIGLIAWTIGMGICAMTGILKEDNSIIIKEFENGFTVLENPNK